MPTSSNPPPPEAVSDETARDVVRSVNRLSRALERYNEKDGIRRREREPSEPSEPYRIPEIRYNETIDPPRLPRNVSWHERVRVKKISLPAATGWSLLGYVVIEVIQALLAGHLHFW